MEVQTVKKLAKRLIWGVGCLVVVGVVVLVVVYMSLGRIVEKAIETAGPMVTKCPVTVDSVDLRPLRGRLRIQNLVIGNPEGFKTPHAFKVDEVRVSLQPGTVLSDLIHVQEVYINGPQITYEIGLGKTNIGTIQGNVDAFLKTIAGEPGAEKPEEPVEPTGSKKKVVIDTVKVENGQINLSGTILQGEALPVPLPTLALNDIGKGQPVSGPQAAAEILNRILHGVLDAVKQSGKAVIDAAKDLGESAKGVGEDLKKGVGGALGGVKGLFKKGD
jgi:hypothetical protein